MNCKFLLWLIFVLIGTALTFPPPTTAAEPKAEQKMEDKKAAEKDKSKSTRVTGELTSVDAKTGMLTVKAKGKEISFTAESKTGKSALERIKTGDKVSVSYTEQKGKMVATSITKADTEGRAEKKAERKGGVVERRGGGCPDDGPCPEKNKPEDR